MSWSHNDHGALDGLGDDDHTIYVPTDGSRQFVKVDISGLTGATEASRYVGATTSGAPVSGTFAVGDYVITQDGSVFVCTTAGSPGTWTEVGAAAGTDADAIHDNVAGEIAAVTEKTTPVDADLLLMEDSADSNNKKRVQVGNLPGGGGGGTVPEWVEYLAVRQSDETAHADDDFFDDASKDAAWVETVVTGNATWTEKRGLISVLADSGASGDVASLLKPINASGPPITIETRQRGSAVGIDFALVGVAFADGTTATDNITLIASLSRANGSNNLQFLSGTLSSINDTNHGTYTLLNGTGPNYMGPLYLRLVQTAANTWAANYSTDSVSWFDLNIAPASRTMTPTHYGLVVAQFNSTTVPLMASFDYFRVYESSLDV